MMRLLLVSTLSLLALSPTPAFAQNKDRPAEAPVGGTIDTIIDDKKTVEAPPAPTGDAVLDRLNALEARVRQLEARNAELEEQATLNQGRLESVEQRAAKAVTFGWGPSFAEPTGNFTFKPRGVVEADAAAFFEREGGYDFNNGTAFRRARIGFEGTAFKTFNYRIEVDFAGNAVNLTDAYLQYVINPRWLLTLGQHKAPYGLESNNSDNYNTFMERGMFTNAFGNVGAERRIGASVSYSKNQLNASIGLFGDNESISRSNNAPASVTDTPDESWGVNGRVTWEPIFDTGKIVHLGVSSFYRTSLKSTDTEDAVRLTDRPNIRVDNGNIADSGVITDVESLTYLGAEAAAVFGPVTLAGEYGRLWLDRPNLPNEAFDGFYVYGSWFITGEKRPFKNGNFDRVKPFKTFGQDGFGALELALRYDYLDLSNSPIRPGNKASSWTLGLNWYLNPYAKIMLNWVRFKGDNTPLDPVGAETKGDAVATRLHLDF